MVVHFNSEMQINCCEDLLVFYSSVVVKSKIADFNGEVKKIFSDEINKTLEPHRILISQNKLLFW